MGTWTAYADGKKVAQVSAQTPEDIDQAFAALHATAADYAGALYEVRDENGDLEYSNPPGVG